MIAKFSLIALLAVVATAQPLCTKVVAPSCGSSAPATVVSGSSSSSGSTSGAIVKNVVAKGKYPVALKNCGPTPDRQIPVTTTRINKPAQVKPIVRLPSNIPAPKTICHTCTCYKTVLRPRVNQQIITVPTIERYIETSHKPVIENIQYEAVPVNCGEESSNGQLQFVEVGGESSQSCSAPVVAAPTCSSPVVESVQVPQVQTVQVPQVQTVQVPQVQSCQVPQVQTVQIPQVQPVQIPQVQTVQIPQVQTVQIPQVQTVQVPQVQSCQSQQVQTIEIPQVQTVQVPQVQTVQVPQVQNVQVPQVQSCQVPQVLLRSSC